MDMLIIGDGLYPPKILVVLKVPVHEDMDDFVGLFYSTT